jgi:transposase
MLTVTQALRIYVCTRPVDMRNGENGLSGLVQCFMGQNPLSGHWFVFRNRRGNRLKVLYFDRDGYAIWSKHLQRGTFRLPDTASGGAVEVDGVGLSMILGGIDMKMVRRRKRFSLKSV